jgi:DNA polymerase III delta subunit
VTIAEVEDLRRVLEKGGPAAAVLVAGGDDAVREGLIEAMAADLKRTAAPVSIARLDAEGAKTDAWSRLAALASDAPLFGEGTVVAITSVGSGAKIHPDLAGFLDSPAPHLRVLFFAEGKAAKSALATKVGVIGQVIVPATLKDRQIQALISQATREAGIGMDGRTQDALLDLVGTDRAALDAAMHLLVEFAGKGGRVTEADLVGLVQRSRRPAPWDLQDAVSERDLGKAVKIAVRELEDARDPRGEAISLYHKIVRQVRTLRTAQALVARGASSSESMERLGLKHDFKWDMTKRGAARYQAAELDTFLKAAPAAEIRIKRGSAGPEPLILDLLAGLIAGGKKGRA